MLKWVRMATNTLVGSYGDCMVLWKRRWSVNDELRPLSLSAILRMLTNTLMICQMTRTNWSLSTTKPKKLSRPFLEKYVQYMQLPKDASGCLGTVLGLQMKMCKRKCLFLRPRPLKVPGTGRAAPMFHPTAQLGTKSGNFWIRWTATCGVGEFVTSPGSNSRWHLVHQSDHEFTMRVPGWPTVFFGIVIILIIIIIIIISRFSSDVHQIRVFTDPLNRKLSFSFPLLAA